MALRLVVESQDRIQRFSLSEGENRVGSHSSCPVQISDLAVSRRHAMIYVRDGRAEIEDLGSTNGTRVDGQRITGRRPLEVGQTVILGSVKARLEAVAEKDLEFVKSVKVEEDLAAVREVSDSRPEGAAESEATQATTLQIGSLQTFTLKRLPALLEGLSQRREPEAMAEEVGTALFDSLLCLEVEISTSERDGLLFRARRDVEVPVEPHTARARRGRFEVRVTFLNPRQARTYAGLLECAVHLVDLAAGADDAGRPAVRAGAEPPELPRPLTLVPRVRRIYAEAARIAQGDIGVLICGESGTGKEVLARYLHAASPRAGRAFVALNCAALPRDLLESELFGIERGVATGVEPRPGKFEIADAGTLFLDEIGDMASETQARILRVLQEGEVYRLGGQKPRSADVRVVAATNRDIDQMMREEKFRSDLYHRIADWTVDLPPLRERRADILNLAAHFLGQEVRRRGVAVAGISRGAVELLESYEWPGNVRQLKREMARAALFLEDGDLLESSHLREAVRRAAQPGPLSLKERLEKVERAEITQSLARHGWSVAEAAKELRMGVSTLYRRMRELGVESPD